MALQLQFKEKHICFCGNFMKKVALYEYDDLFFEVKTKIKAGTYGPDDLITCNVSAQHLIKIYTQLGQERESLTANINAEMKADLFPQLMTLVASTDPEIAAEANEVLVALSDANTRYQESLAQEIATGRAWLMK